jgi:hypothetical protein
LLQARNCISQLRARNNLLPRCKKSGRRALLASGQIVMRKVDGWQSLAEKPSDQIIDLAA